MRRATPAGYQPRALLQRARDVLLGARTRTVPNQRTDDGVRIGGVAHRQALQHRGDTLEVVVIDRAVHQMPRPQRTTLTGEQSQFLSTPGRHGIEVGVCAHDHRRLAAEFEGDVFERVRRLRHDLGADRVGSGERDHVHARIGGQVLTDVDSTRDHVEHTWGQLRFLRRGTQQQRLQRREIRGLQHDRATGGQRGADLEEIDEEGGVERRDRGDHSARGTLHDTCP